MQPNGIRPINFDFVRLKFFSVTLLKTKFPIYNHLKMLFVTKRMAREEIIDEYQSIISTEEKKQASYQYRASNLSSVFKRLS